LSEKRAGPTDHPPSSGGTTADRPARPDLRPIKGFGPQAASINSPSRVARGDLGGFQGLNGTMILPCSPRRGILISSPGREPGENRARPISCFWSPGRATERRSAAPTGLQGEKKRRGIVASGHPGLAAWARDQSAPVGASVEKRPCQYGLPPMQDVVTPWAIAYRAFGTPSPRPSVPQSLSPFLPPSLRASVPSRPRPSVPQSLFLYIPRQLARKLCTTAYAHASMSQTIKFESKSIKTGSKSGQKRSKKARISSCPS